MAETQGNIPILNRKEWQTMMPSITATAAGSFVASDQTGLCRFSLHMINGTVHYLYDNNNDDYLPITSAALAGTFVAGACGQFHPWSVTFTATGGSTTTINVNSAVSNINGLVVGSYVEFLSGTAGNVGRRRLITNIETGGGTGTIILTIAAAPSSVANADTFRINSGSFFVLGTGTLASGSFKRWDIATMAWSTLTITGLPATWGTDGRMVTPAIYDSTYDSGTASAGTGTTITDATKAWTVDQWINSQVRITGGTGIGQIRRITDSDATSLTVSAWTTTPDATSTYVIEGDENAIFVLGNNAVTMYKYSISGNSWATVSPTTARVGAPIAGMTANFVGKTGNSVWADITDIKDGRYIYSLRGGTSVLDRFDIAGGTAGAGAWLAITYAPSLQTFATGDSAFWDYENIIIAKEGTTAIPQRFYKYNVVNNVMTPFSSDWYFGGAAVLGDKIWVKKLSSLGTVRWLYCLQSATANLRRIMIY